MLLWILDFIPKWHLALDCWFTSTFIIRYISIRPELEVDVKIRCANNTKTSKEKYVVLKNDCKFTTYHCSNEFEVISQRLDGQSKIVHRHQEKLGRSRNDWWSAHRDYEEENSGSGKFKNFHGISGYDQFFHGKSESNTPSGGPFIIERNQSEKNWIFLI